MTQTSRRVWRTPKAGSINDIVLTDEPLAPVAAGKVRIEVRAIGLNFADIMALLGLYSATPEGSFIPGLECAGRTAAGDDVIVLTRFGAYATHVDADPRYCIPLPAGWTHEQGAAFLVQALTALYAIENLGAVRPGDKVLVHSAAGGVGLYAMAICKALGAHPVGTVSSESKRAFLNERGYTDIIVRDKDRLTGSYHLVLESIGGSVFRESYDLLAPTGRLVTFGAASFTPAGARVNWLRTAWHYLTRPRLDPLAMISDNKAVLGFNLIWLWEQVDLLAPLVARLQSLNLPPPHVGSRHAFTDALAAITHLQSGNSIGKVVLTV